MPGALGDANPVKAVAKGSRKNNLDIEDQEDDGVEIVAGLELHPGIARGLKAALIDGVFRLSGLGEENFLAHIHASARGATANPMAPSSRTMIGRYGPEFASSGHRHGIRFGAVR